MNECTQVVLDALEAHGCKPTKTGGGYIARCPAHKDLSPSLKIDEGDDGRVLVYCHARCKTPDIVALLGLKMADLFPQKTSRNGRVIVAEYSYIDEKGELLSQNLRYLPKQFLQRRPYDGTWAWGVSAGWYRKRPNGEWSRVRDNERPEPERDRKIKAVRRVPYRFPELIAADTGRVVFIAEGEKSVDILRELGLIASCSPGGAGKWHLIDHSPLHGRRVIVLPDNDAPGREHAKQVVSSLDGKAEVRVIELPGISKHGDVSDWLDAGGTVQQLKQLVRAAL